MFGIVINSNGYKVAFVLLDKNKNVMYYKLKEGESIVEKDWKIANEMVKPCWTGTEWIETATEEDIKEYRRKFEEN